MDRRKPLSGMNLGRALAGWMELGIRFMILLGLSFFGREREERKGNKKRANIE